MQQQQLASQGGNSYRQDFVARRKERRGEPVWLIERRQNAMLAFERLGFPSRPLEAWRNFDPTPLQQTHYTTVPLIGEVAEASAALDALLPGAYRLVFIDGYYSETNSRLPEQPGLTVRPLQQALRSDEVLLARRLGALAPTDEHAFCALNAALFDDGAFVHVGRNVAADRPLLLAFLSSEGAAGQAVYPRSLIVADEGAQLQVIEYFQGPATPYLCCPVSEIHVGPNASLQYYKLQEEGAAALHLGTVAARLGRDGRLSGHSFAIGGKLARTDIIVDLPEPGAELEIDGLYLAGDGQYSDHHTLVRHIAERCRSEQRFKGVLSGKSEAVYDGLVKVAKGAQKTDAHQDNRNLLLSKRSLAHSNPRLEIFADDVKCAHGSSIGELDQNALFYLRCRGIGHDDAQGLLTYAFVAEILASVEIEALREYERRAAFRVLPGDQIVEELA